MNIDFSAAPGFSAYVVLLMFSGIAMIVMASPAVKRLSMGLRALNTLFGVAFLGYGFYLAFLFHGGGYLIFFKAFILPVLLIVRTIRSARATRSQVPGQSISPTFPQHSPVAPYPSQSGVPQAHWDAPSAYGEQSAQH